MKKSLLLSIVFCATILMINAQTKPATTTKKTTTTTTTKKTTVPAKKPAAKTTVAKPTAAKTTVPAAVTPVEAPKAAVVPTPPVEVVKEPAGPPVTGPLGDGPKSYQTEPASKGTSKTTPTNTTTSKPAKSVSAKPEKVKRTVVSNDRVRSYIGIRGGYNLSTLEGLKDEVGADGTVKNLAGYMGGLVINLGVSKAFSIQPEILYSQQGAEAGDGTNSAKAKLNFVNVPVLLKLAFGSPNVKFFINAGPYIGYAISASTEINIGGSKSSEKIEFSNEYDAAGEKDNRIDFGGMGGAGFQFAVGGALLTIEGRYQYGMADPTLYKDGIPASVPKNFQHQRVMTGTVGLLFPLGGK